MIADRTCFWTVAFVVVFGLTGSTGCADTPVAPTQEIASDVANPCLSTSGSQTEGHSSEPRSVSLTTHASQTITFGFSGTISHSGGCLTVPPGTPFSGRFTFNTATPATPSFQPTRVDYFGVSVEITVGSESIRNNDPARGKIQIHNGPPSGDSYSVIVEGGFNTGGISGRWMEDFVWVVSGGPSMFSDLSLPTGPNFFGPLVGSRVCIGDCFNTQVLEGRITDLWRESNS